MRVLVPEALAEMASEPQVLSVDRGAGEHVFRLVTVASGAGRGVCSCGWRSPVSDDGRGDYTSGDIFDDWQEHVAGRR